MCPSKRDSWFQCSATGISRSQLDTWYQDNQIQYKTVLEGRPDNFYCVWKYPACLMGYWVPNRGGGHLPSCACLRVVQLTPYYQIWENHQCSISFHHSLQLSALHSRKRILWNQSFKFSWNWWPFSYCILLFQWWNILCKLTFNGINYISHVSINHFPPIGLTI